MKREEVYGLGVKVVEVIEKFLNRRDYLVPFFFSTFNNKALLI